MGSTTTQGDPRNANLIITLVPRAERALTQQQFEAAVRPALEAIPGSRIRFGADGMSGAKASITLIGDDAGRLAAAARELETQMRSIPSLSGARSVASLERPELQIMLRDARAAELGVSAAMVGATARIATIGDVDQALARFNLPDRQIPIRVMLAEDARDDLDALRALRVTGRADLAIPLDAVAEIRHGAGPAQIDRLDRVRKATIEAETNGMPLGEATKLIAALPIMQSLPAGVREREVGDKEVMGELFGGFIMALGAGVLLVYLVLVLLFGGFLQPLTIMSALPLSLGGALMALLLAQKALGVSAVIGVLMLMGIVAKNSILLVEYAVEARRAGFGARRRAGRGGPQAGPAHRDDDHRDDRRHGAYRRRHRRRCRIPRADGAGGDRRAGHLHPAQPGGGAGGLYGGGRLRRMGDCGCGAARSRPRRNRLSGAAAAGPAAGSRRPGRRCRGRRRGRPRPKQRFPAGR